MYSHGGLWNHEHPDKDGRKEKRLFCIPFKRDSVFVDDSPIPNAGAAAAAPKANVSPLPLPLEAQGTAAAVSKTDELDQTLYF
jgi:hypothetical protein